MSLASGDLTTLASAKAFIPGPPSDAVLQRLIPAASRIILGVLNRPLLVPKLYTQQFNGTGTTGLILPYWPVLALPALALTINGQDFTVAPVDGDNLVTPGPWGYRYPAWDGLPPGNPVALELVGGGSYYGSNQGTVVTYNAGYQVTDEEQTVPATLFRITPSTPYGIWATDEGVTYSDGVALTTITSGTPIQGQYLPPNPELPTPRLYYTFAAADEGEVVLLSYGFIPFDVEQLCIDLIQERTSYRGRIGIRSQSLASQESISYDTSGLTEYIRRSLEAYVSVLPPPIGGSV